MVVMFASGGTVENYLVEGASLGEEIVIDFANVAVAKARKSMIPSVRVGSSSSKYRIGFAVVSNMFIIAIFLDVHFYRYIRNRI